MKVLVTGAAGLVGSECCRLFAAKGWEVTGVDNFMRGKFFGQEGDTSLNSTLLKGMGVQFRNLDIRDKAMVKLLKDADAVIHTAAQPSHPKSIEIPMEDFQVNAFGTLSILDTLRKLNPGVIFVFCSTNKVYGDAPNHFAYEKAGKRFEPVDPALWDGFDTGLRIDRSLHTPFGVSKTTADLYAQEYSYLYGLRTGVFRMGCITGAGARAVEMHNWEPYFVKKALAGEKITIYGYRGYQVRDVIHAEDLARLFYESVLHPRPGEVYNIGGGRPNSISLLEAADLIEEVTGKRLRYEFGKEREGDHKWWISDMSKAHAHYPGWSLQRNLKNIFEEITERLIRASPK